MQMAESLAQIARARIAEEKAKSLGMVLRSNLGDDIRRKTSMLDSIFLLQVHKEALIADACSYITYVQHGKVEDACTKLLENPSLDAGKLISFNYKKDMCDCSSCTRFEKFLPIPAAMNSGRYTCFYLFILINL